MAMSKENYSKWIADKKIAFIGLGVSHTDLVRQYAAAGYHVTVLDRGEQEALGEVFGEFSAMGVHFVLGQGYLDHLNDYDVVFRSPGVRYLQPAVQNAIESGVTLTSEMETFFALCPAKIYGITGSDGKTTTTSLIGEMLRAAGKRVFVGGNIGRALLPLIDEITEDDAVVVELSSFQLISMRQSPDVAVVTNLSPNHLDAHKDMDEYVAAKENIWRHQNAFSRTVLNADNEITYGMRTGARGECLLFGRSNEISRGTFIDGQGYLCFAKAGATERICHKDQIRLKGDHFAEDYLAASAAVMGEVPADVICRVAQSFGGVEHRCERVREAGGVQWVNDSIATSPTRTIAGLSTYDEKIILIAGGYDKHIPYEPLAPAVTAHVKLLILVGDTSDRIQQTVENDVSYTTGNPEILRAASMEEAVTLAAARAVPGDTVALSPASASFDLYKNFEERGAHFKRLVAAL